jgi:uncharacterized YigZ family protein
MADEYVTLASPARVKQVIENSRFYGTCREVATVEEAMAVVEEVRAEAPDANHHAFGMRIGVGAHVYERGSDDGEPAGTAGAPILQAIASAEVTNVVVVVTRFFGGIKLGVGGLIKAYRGVAQAALAEAGTVVRPIWTHVRLSPIGYEELGAALRALDAAQGSVDELEYGAEVAVRASVPPSRVEGLAAVVRELTRGQAKLEEV